MVLSTLSRTAASFITAVIGAGIPVRLAAARYPRLAPFLTPAELARVLRAHGLRPLAASGVRYDGSRDRFELTRDLA